MKKYYALLLLMIPFIQLQAQREYLPTQEDLDHFHTTRTYVVLESNPLSDYNFEIQDAVKKFWDITEYEFIMMKDFAQKSADKNASFLYLAGVSFEKDKSNTRYKFLCLSLGGDHISIDDLKDVANIPMSFYGVDADHYAYKLGIMVRFLQYHVRLITEQHKIVDSNVYNYYNKNMADVKGKTLYLVEDEVAREISSEAKIRAIYPGEVRIVDRETIKELIMAEDENAVVLHKVGPEGKKQNARVYKILIGAADAKFYYFDYHKVNKKNPDAFLSSDFKKLARATK
ncbi:MAG: hypothetical protein KAS82_07505 [Bacteroidales bacterium]|nr:hypothetical protein [Bacteroidales bacterium]